ncbi:MAG: HCO3- transporter [Nitrococcus mobilis]|nr:HCO3- transporter [Nitrococcus mobilis]
MAPVDSLQRTGRFAGGILEDLRRRVLPWYGDDFRQGLHPKALASVLFLFFACLANAVAFGGLTEVVTDGAIGTVEMIVVTAAGGVIFALFAGQPLTILGGTGPIVIFTGLLYAACERYGIPFLTTYAWTGIWSGVFLIILALTDAAAMMRLFTRFTDEIFAALIAVIFIVEAAKKAIVPVFIQDGDPTRELASLVVALMTYALARGMKRVTQTPYLRRTIRNLISDFGPALAIVIATAFSFLYVDVPFARPQVPETFATTTGRPWLVDLLSVPTWAIFATIIPALMATILLFLDQNITTRLVNAPSYQLKKGGGFHLDLLVLGFIVVGASVFALPWIVAATVHALNHVKSLAETEIIEVEGQRRERIVGVRENRLSALTIHILIGVSILLLPLIKLIPMAVLFGLFLYMGFVTLAGNQFFDRITLWFTDRNLYPNTHYVRNVPRRIIHYFTAIQVACFAALWILKSSAIGILFPVLIALLAPLRLLLDRFFKREHLQALDADEDMDEAEVAVH